MFYRLIIFLGTIIPHIAIIISGMYIVFYLINNVNTAMKFINNPITTVLVLILSIASIITSIIAIHYFRRYGITKKKKKSDSSDSINKKVNN